MCHVLGAWFFILCYERWKELKTPRGILNVDMLCKNDLMNAKTLHWIYAKNNKLRFTLTLEKKKCLFILFISFVLRLMGTIMLHWNYIVQLISFVLTSNMLKNFSNMFRWLVAWIIRILIILKHWLLNLHYSKFLLLLFHAAI